MVEHVPVRHMVASSILALSAALLVACTAVVGSTDPVAGGSVDSGADTPIPPDGQDGAASDALSDAGVDACTGHWHCENGQPMCPILWQCLPDAGDDYWTLVRCDGTDQPAARCDGGCCHQ